LALRRHDRVSDAQYVSGSKSGEEGLRDLEAMQALFAAAGYGADRIRYDSSVVRGLEYYTGPVFECELLMETKDEDGRTVRFGSVGGGGRYDDLVARFTGQQVPATGFSIGVSRLYSALKLAGKAEESATLAPVVVLVMDKDRQGDYWRMVQQLRAGGIRAEMYVGTAGMKAQMKYADKRGAPSSSSRAATRRRRARCRSRICGSGAKRSPAPSPAMRNMPRSGLRSSRCRKRARRCGEEGAGAVMAGKSKSEREALERQNTAR
jgi:hypothetical protein